MCIISYVDEALTGILAMAPAVPASSASSSSSSSSRLVQIMKPKLSRRITRTPKINLNKYWNLFESIMENGGSSEVNQRRNTNEFHDKDMNNEINENISNEQRERDDLLVRRNNERNSRVGQHCACHFCLISDLRNVTVSERNEEVTEL